MNNIVLISNYWHFEEEKSSSRYLTLANMIAEKEENVEVITSSFYHATKTQRKEKKRKLPYKVTLIKETGYKKNISVERILSHKKFAKNVVNYLETRKPPDVIYLFVPPLDLAYNVIKYAKKYDIRVIIDILDLWPEAYKMVIDIPIISDLLFYPMMRKANKVYSEADQIVGVSETYVKRALQVNKKCSKGISAYLGIELEKFDKLVDQSKEIMKPTNEIWISYIGTLGHSYVIPTIIDALKIVRTKTDINIKFIVMGNGPLKEEFERLAEKSEIYFEFTGALPYAEMIGILACCDIAVNPIKSNSAASIINKVGDYAAAGLPVINTQESKEYIELLNRYEAGFNCENSNIEDIAEKIVLLCRDNKLRRKMGINNRQLAEEKFDRKVIYKEIIDAINKRGNKI